MHRAITGLLEVGNIQLVTPAFFFRVVGQSAVRNQRRMIVAILRVRHLQRRENIFSREFLQCLPAHPLYDHRQQEKSRVAVEPVASRRKIQSLLPYDHPQCIFVRRHTVYVGARQLHQRQVIAQAAGVVQQLQNRDFLPVIRKLGNVFADIVVDGKLSLFLKQQDARRRELLRRRSDVEHALR